MGFIRLAVKNLDLSGSISPAELQIMGISSYSGMVRISIANSTPVMKGISMSVNTMSNLLQVEQFFIEFILFFMISSASIGFVAVTQRIPRFSRIACNT